jgi:hypothetical protein
MVKKRSVVVMPQTVVCSVRSRRNSVDYRCKLAFACERISAAYDQIEGHMV